MSISTSRRTALAQEIKRNTKETQSRGFVLTFFFASFFKVMLSLTSFYVFVLLAIDLRNDSTAHRGASSVPHPSHHLTPEPFSGYLFLGVSTMQCFPHFASPSLGHCVAASFCSPSKNVHVPLFLVSTCSRVPLFHRFFTHELRVFAHRVLHSHVACGAHVHQHGAIGLQSVAFLCRRCCAAEPARADTFVASTFLRIHHGGQHDHHVNSAF